MNKPKVWKSGIADEPWKVAICERDIEIARELLSTLCYILTDCGKDLEQGERALCEMSGADIVHGVKAYAAKSARSINAQMPPPEANGLKSQFLRRILQGT